MTEDSLQFEIISQVGIQNINNEIANLAQIYNLEKSQSTN